MDKPDPPCYRESDLELLKSGNFADGVVKCQGRTWNIHRALLSSRLKFFKAAFAGSFVEAKTGELELPEATPDAVDIAIRHLYGEVLDTDVLNTPLLCVCSWKLADYLQLEALKPVVISSLKDHLNAMVLLASSDKRHRLSKPSPRWLGHFVTALEEVCAHTVLKPLQYMFVSYLWVTRFEIMYVPQVWAILGRNRPVELQLQDLLVWHTFHSDTLWIPTFQDIEHDIQSKRKIRFEDSVICFECGKEIKSGEEPRFYNPLPSKHGARASRKGIGQLRWCNQCVDNFNQHRNWPWVLDGGEKNQKLEIEAWSWAAI